MKENARNPRLSAGDLTVVALVGALILVGKTVLRLPISLPGHGGVLWIAALIVGRAVLRPRWAGALMGLVGGLLVAFLSPGSEGLLNVAKYVLPGITLDVLIPLFGRRLDRAAPAAIAGAAAHATKVLVDVLAGVAIGLPPAILFAGIGYITTLHVAFGALGGLIASGVLVALHRARIPQLRCLEDGRTGESFAPPPDAAPRDGGATS